MRPFAVVLLAALAPPVLAADTDEDRAREAAVAAAKAFKANDLESLMKLVSVPFAQDVGERARLLEKAADARTYLKETVGVAKFRDQLSAEITRVMDAPTVREKVAGAKADARATFGLEAIQTALGEKGYWVACERGERKAYFLIRIQDGKPLLVGLGLTTDR